MLPGDDPNKTEKFWMVHVDGGMRAPMYRHKSKELAITEAKRLTLLQRSMTFVLETVEAYQTDYDVDTLHSEEVLHVRKVSPKTGTTAT